jgi:hypothetical protein
MGTGTVSSKEVKHQIAWVCASMALLLEIDNWITHQL